jgi:hypothetical protein
VRDHRLDHHLQYPGADVRHDIAPDQGNALR